MFHEHLADLGRTRERELSDDRIGRQFGTNLPRDSCNDVDNAGRYAGTHREFDERERRQWSFTGWLTHDRASGRERGCDLARQHCVREIPRRDAGDHSDGLLDNNDTLVVARVRNRVAVNSLRFLGKPLDVVCSIGNLTSCLSQGFALFRCQDLRQVFLRRHHQREPLAQYRGSFLGSLLSPRNKSAFCGDDRATRLRRTALRYLRNRFTRGRIHDGQCIAAIGIDPLSVNVGLCFQ